MDTALQSSVYVSSPEFAGWLMKRGFHWRKLWKKRWVALHGAEIVYMDKEPTLENSSTMTITKAQITTATVIDRDDLEGNANGFAIHINDGHTPTWYLRAESAREKKSWLMRLSHVHAIVKWLEDFEKVKVLGVGGTGIVYELLHKSNGQRFAMKEMEIKNKAQMQMAISEAEMLKDIMENVSHPNIMHIEKVFQVGSKFYLVFPLCTGGELYEHIIRKGHFTERDAAMLIRDLISGLHALHQHDILHLDIKPENILFDSMGDDAKIKITDFGLSKLFSAETSANKSVAKFSMQLMDEKLKNFQETGELNREKLRGTIGYMAPELILVGYCTKATDVFAAGVVLYILLCGRPPFNSKSNREVLEKTAKGQYSMSGPEWDEISEEAKDLVRRMLVVNPDERIGTEDILAHPWLKQLEQEDSVGDDGSSLASSHSHSNDISHASSLSFQKNVSQNSTGSRSNTMVNRKGSNNLIGALRHLSGHVKQMRSEKLATNVTKLVSIMQNGVKSNTLAQMYLIPLSMHDIESAAAVGNGAQDFENILLNNDFREGLARAFSNLDDAGRLTTDQFMALIRYIYSLGDAKAAEEAGTKASSSGGSSRQSGNNSVGLGPIIISRFVDRDNDGFITADDIFAAQALIMQRSQDFLRVVFRIYTEAIWYPGRQLNYLSMVQNSAAKPSADAPTTPNSGLRVLPSSDQAAYLTSVVEPPKFITQRHVAAVFEKLGYDPSCAHKVFMILCEAVHRIKTAGQASSGVSGLGAANVDVSSGEEDNAPNTNSSSSRHSPAKLPSAKSRSNSTSQQPNAALAKAFGDMGVGATGKEAAAVSVPTAATNSNNSNSNGSGAISPPTAPTNANTASNAAARMDFQDFCRCVELDDILVQAIFRKTRYRVMSLLQEVENRVRKQPMDDDIAESLLAAVNGLDESAAKRESLARNSSTDIAALVIEQELKTALQQSGGGRESMSNKAAFPIAHAVTRATGNVLSSALNMAAKVVGGSNATNTPQQQQRNSVRKSFQNTAPDSDDEV